MFFSGLGILKKMLKGLFCFPFSIQNNETSIVLFSDSIQRVNDSKFDVDKAPSNSSKSKPIYQASEPTPSLDRFMIDCAR